MFDGRGGRRGRPCNNEIGRQYMAVLKFKRFTKVGVLKEIGRELLGRFFGQVGGGGNGKQLELPPASARLSPIVI